MGREINCKRCNGSGTIYITSSWDEYDSGTEATCGKCNGKGFYTVWDEDKMFDPIVPRIVNED